MHHHWHRVALLALALLLCASVQPVAANGLPQPIQFGDSVGFAYSPAQLTVSQDAAVVWLGSFASHPLVSVDGLWATVNTGSQFSYTFATPGSHTYYCQFHGTPTGGMRGQIVVLAPLPVQVYLPLVTA